MASNRETGLLTRFVPERLKHSGLYRWWLRFTRILQFLSAVISLAMFSSRIYKVYRLINSFNVLRSIDQSSLAVEGILAAAVLYTIISTIMMCIMRQGGPVWLRWLWVFLDILFVGAFIAVSVLTSPNGGPSGPRHCYDTRNQGVSGSGKDINTSDDSCNLPWSTFILAIISTILHAITAAFNEVKDRHRRNESLQGKGHYANGHGMAGHNGYQSNNGRASEY